ncbi:GGDEF domain-containing protein [Undibacterium sp. TS12]|uniref:putative bifunctional diguanylate cyclase/phosphodiesterase n=1 Tax=Undibacterium sp. TS12 TaxID=2908202 RepID=UPI001F4CA5DC|nr:GGDEF domain-containing protein [Undibacterium sp. TS12]MCH8619335.1 GGDEF domain-containing protein [Undibacterium sp. TS12]
MSGFLLEAAVAIHSSVNAFAVGAYQVLWVVGFFYLVLSLGLYYSSRHLRAGAAILIGTVYASSFAIVCLINQYDIAKFGYIFIYTTPIIARLFFGTRLAIGLMVFNILPFLLLLLNRPLLTVPGFDVTLPASNTYVQSLLFLFFNTCVPLAVFRVLHELDLSALRYRQASAELVVSHAQYEEVFQNAGTALLLTDASGQILQANQQANSLLGRNASGDEEDLALFAWLSLDNSVRLKSPNSDESENMRMSAYRTRDGKLVALENISQTSTDHYIVALRDVSGLHSMHHALQLSLEREDYLSRHDALTNLPNRDMLRSHLQEILSNIDENKVTALVSFRLNSIRHANQQFGAHTGDILLRRFAEELSRVLPKNCFCARLRSIVFSFVVEQSRTPGEIIKLVERVRNTLPRELEVNGENLLVQFSAGIALVRPEDTEPDDLIRRSEVALDTARRSSDQSVTLFDEDDAQQIRRSVEIEVGIVNGLKQNEFRMVYQPKVDRDGNIASLEALLRWESPNLGNVTPAEFIPIAERAGLIRLISNFVMNQVSYQIRQWLDRYGDCPVIALNLSATDIARNDLLHLIDSSCHRYDIAPSYIEFEITETGLIANEALTIHHLGELKTRGFNIAIDDFGTGYSSLSKLSHFPAQSVKIDRSFVAQIGHNQKSEMIIKAIISLANILSCRTVAEGVENVEQESFLKEIGCDYFQGYYYYRPLEVSAMELLLAEMPAREQAPAFQFKLA